MSIWIRPVENFRACDTDAVAELYEEGHGSFGLGESLAGECCDIDVPRTERDRGTSVQARAPAGRGREDGIVSVARNVGREEARPLIEGDERHEISGRRLTGILQRIGDAESVESRIFDRGGFIGAGTIRVEPRDGCTAHGHITEQRTNDHRSTFQHVHADSTIVNWSTTISGEAAAIDLKLASVVVFANLILPRAPVFLENDIK
ncbi:hypothetical protein LZC95_04665 [Pendulispora brunnea]|uniref:Uncharacterized protein n=1 Tax=Pendulispora brunnea TaxID=2905690 RepID=A0ABZ2KEX2_9BACT